VYEHKWGSWRGHKQAMMTQVAGGAADAFNLSYMYLLMLKLMLKLLIFWGGVTNYYM
jgi:hypothetical protein